MKKSVLKKAIIILLTMTMLAGVLLGAVGCGKKTEGSGQRVFHSGWPSVKVPSII